VAGEALTPLVKSASGLIRIPLTALAIDIVDGKGEAISGAKRCQAPSVTTNGAWHLLAAFSMTQPKVL